MTMQQLTRRIILGAFTVTLLLPASAAGEGPVFGPDDFGTRADFEDHCDTAGGTFIDTEDGNLWCHNRDDSQTVCDAEGNDCYTIHREDQEPTSPHGPTGPTGGVGPVEEGGTDPAPPVAESPAPAADNPTASEPQPSAGEAGIEAPPLAGAQPSAGASDDEQDQDDTPGKKGKKAKKGKKGGKGRKR
jgi:hypothetical protein